jgi:hypothetical protein
MAFDPKSIRRGVKPAPRKMVIYGPPKIGKSSLVASADDALLIATEDRVNHIDCAKTDVVHSYDEIMEIFEYLVSGSPYRTVIIDTLDWMEPLVWQYVCKKKGFKSLIDDTNKEVNFGRGMKYHAVEAWKMFLENCDVLREQANMSIVLVAHSQIEKMTPPDSDAYDRHTFKIDKNAVAVVEEWADIIGFYSREIVVTKEDAGFGKKRGKALSIDNSRVLNLQSTSPAWISGNSFGLPDVVVTLDEAPAIMRYLLTGNAEKTKSKKGE